MREIIKTTPSYFCELRPGIRSLAVDFACGDSNDLLIIDVDEAVHSIEDSLHQIVEIGTFGRNNILEPILDLPITAKMRRRAGHAEDNRSGEWSAERLVVRMLGSRLL